MGEIIYYHQPVFYGVPQTEQNKVPKGSPQVHPKFQGHPSRVVVCAPSGSPVFGPVYTPPRSPVFGPVYLTPGYQMFGPGYSPQVGSHSVHSSTSKNTCSNIKAVEPNGRGHVAPTQTNNEKDHEKKDELRQCHNTFLDCLATYKRKFLNLSQENEHINDDIGKTIREVKESFQNCIKSFGSGDFQGKYDAYLKKTDKVFMKFDTIEKFFNLISEAKSLELLINKCKKLNDNQKEEFRSSFKNLFDQFSFISDRIKANQDPTQIYLNAKNSYREILKTYEKISKQTFC